MRTSCVISVIATLALLASQPAMAQQDGVPRSVPGSDAAYKKLRAQCEQTSCAPSGGAPKTITIARAPTSHRPITDASFRRGVRINGRS